MPRNNLYDFTRENIYNELFDYFKENYIYVIPTDPLAPIKIVEEAKTNSESFKTKNLSTNRAIFRKVVQDKEKTK